jgi:hypothetical protein
MAAFVRAIGDVNLVVTLSTWEYVESIRRS